MCFKTGHLLLQVGHVGIFLYGIYQPGSYENATFTFEVTVFLHYYIHNWSILLVETNLLDTTIISR